jgi:hypothetical protein
MVVVAVSAERRVALHHRALWLEYFTVGWNVVEGVVAISAGVIAGSVALIGFGADSAIEVISSVGLLWRLRKAGPHAAVSEESAAEKRALYVVAITFFLLAIYITWEAVKSLISREEPLTSPVGIILAVLSLAVMPTLAVAKQRVGKEMGSRALIADSKETWVCSYLSLSLLLGVGAYAVVGWCGLTQWVRSRCSRSSCGRDGRRWLKRASEPTARTDLMDHWLSAPFDLSKCSPGVRGRQAVHVVASGRRGAERGNGGVSPDLMPRLGVTDWIRPLTRCTMCNGLLAQASAAEVVDRVPPGTLYDQRRFTVCTACSKVYWKGAHHVRISRLIAGAMRHPGTGHRTLPHTADIRIEAWAPGREQCIAEAVRGMVDTFADTSRHGETAVREVRVPARRDA